MNAAHLTAWLRPPSKADAREWRIAVYPTALLLVFATVLIMIVQTREGVLIGGDFPAFYAAGDIVLAGDAHDLYDVTRQTEAQTGLDTNTPPGSLPFAYPPIVAVLFAPLAALAFLDAYTVYTLVLVGSLVLAMSIGWRSHLNVAGRVPLFIVLALVFTPMLRSVIGSQTPPLYLLLLALLLVQLERPDRSEWRLVVTFVFMLMKPQLGLPLIGLALIHDWRSLLRPAVAAGLISYALNALVLGITWPFLWLEGLPRFASIQNPAIRISWIGALHRLWDHPLMTAVGVVLSIATIAVLVSAWRPSSQVPLYDRLGLAVAGVILVSPHSMFYETALLVVPLLGFGRTRRETRLVMCFAGIAGYAEPYLRNDGPHLFFYLAVAVLIGQLVKIRRAEAQHVTSDIEPVPVAVAA